MAEEYIMERVYLSKKDFQTIVYDAFEGQTKFQVINDKEPDEDLKGHRVFEFMGIQYVEKLED